MSASPREQPRYYGGLFNLEHRVMSGAVAALAVIVLVLLGTAGQAAPDDLEIAVAAPLAQPAGEASLDGWLRPTEIRVHAPAVGPPILDERLLQRFRFVEPPKPAPPPVPGAAPGPQPRR